MDFCTIQNSDENAVAGLLHVYAETNEDIFRKDYDGCYPSEAAARAMLAQDYADFVSEFVAQDDRYIFVLKEEDEITAALRVIRVSESGWYLEALETGPKWRGKGCARQLLRETIRCMRALGAGSIASVVRRDNAASRAAHEACGFTDTGKCAQDTEGAPIEDCLVYRYIYQK